MTLCCGFVRTAQGILVEMVSRRSAKLTRPANGGELTTVLGGRDHDRKRGYAWRPYANS